MFYPKLIPAVPFLVCFEGEVEDKKIEMTQAQIDAIVNGRISEINSEKKKLETTARDAVAQLAALKGSVTMTDQVRTQYETDLEELRKKVMTTEELKNQEIERVRGKAKNDLETAQTNAKKWQSAHNDLLIDFGIEQANALHGVVKGSAPVIRAYLKPQTRLLEEKDEQGNIRQYVPVIDFRETDAKGVEKVMTLPVEKVVGRMKEKPEFFNLFDSTVKSGIGGTNGSSSSGSENPDTMNAEQYAAWSKKTGKY